MKTSSVLATLIIPTFSVWAASTAQAHVSVASGIATADATQEVTFGIGHGCAGTDTLEVKVQIPAAVASLRALHSDWAKAQVEKDSAGKITAVTWTRPEADIAPGDDHFYKVAIRIKVPNKPFTQLYFPTIQICQSASGKKTTTEWIGTGEHNHEADAGAPADAAAGPEPAPALLIAPARLPGWNKYTVNEHVHDLAVFFKDAQIVWSGTAAYSFNPNTAALIKTEPGTQSLTEVHPGTLIWVKY